jgi:hypothetical protein
MLLREDREGGRAIDVDDEGATGGGSVGSTCMGTVKKNSEARGALASPVGAGDVTDAPEKEPLCGADAIPDSPPMDKASAAVAAEVAPSGDTGDEAECKSSSFGLGLNGSTSLCFGAR